MLLLLQQVSEVKSEGRGAKLTHLTDGQSRRILALMCSTTLTNYTSTSPASSSISSMYFEKSLPQSKSWHAYRSFRCSTKFRMDKSEASAVESYCSYVATAWTQFASFLARGHDLGARLWTAETAVVSMKKVLQYCTGEVVTHCPALA